MKFLDVVKINVRSGTGGNGCCAFRRERFIPRGGPSGGDGGRGGDLIFRGSPHKATLLDFREHRHFAAGRGEHGRGKDQYGAAGESRIVDVPFGTVVRDAETGEVLLECLDETPRVLLAGGAGGRGNLHFKSSTNRAPMQCEPGRPGEERWVVLELKLIADVGLVGFPNAGKSTLISRISHARPKIADYPFTTLTPNLGVVRVGDDQTFVVADIPGLIEGAHTGAGLGDQFLRHIERTALLVIVLDLSELAERDPIAQYETLLDELERYSPALLEKPRAVAINKLDLIADAQALTPLRRRLKKGRETVFEMSAIAGTGLDELVTFLARAVTQARAERRARSQPGAATHASGSIPRTRSLPPSPASGDTSAGPPPLPER